MVCTVVEHRLRPPGIRVRGIPPGRTRAARSPIPGDEASRDFPGWTGRCTFAGLSRPEVAHPVSSSPTLDVRIWRGADAGAFAAYEVPAAENQTVLDVVTWVQRHREPALAYRFACRVGVCGSCAMTVNGRARWTCRSHVKDVAGDGRIVIEPLRNLPRIKDLVCDLTPFFDKWRRAGGRFEGTATRREPMPAIEPGTEARRTVDAGHRVHQLRGVPQRLRRGGMAPRLSRPGRLEPRLDPGQRRTAHRGPDEIIDTVAAGGGCTVCHTHGSCTEHCPVGISPTAAIAGLKRRVFRRWLPGRRA